MRRLPIVLLALAVVGGLLAWRVPPRADLVEFLPAGRTPASAFLFRELQSGVATTLLLAAIEGAPREELARISRETAAGLRASGRFAFVGDGSLRLSEEEQAFLFRYRYLLSSETRPEAFSAERLRPKLEALLDGLRSAASPLLARFGFADPTGAFIGLAAGWLGDSRIESADGAWFAPGGTRALLVARGQGAGLDAEAQRAAIDEFRAAFEATRPGQARLLLSGPGVFAAAAAAQIRRDVEMITLASAGLLAAFLYWRFRSLLLLGLVAVPLAAGTVAGYAAAAAAFGSVHAISLGFGMTMLGVTVDYPILLLTLARPDETMDEAAARIWPTLRLAAVTAAAGLLAMLGSGLPGLVQIGIFAGAGLLSGAIATRWVLPRLVPEGTRIAARPLPAWIGKAVGALRGRPRWALAAVAAAVLVLVATGGPPWQRDLAALSPIPSAQQALDAELRGQLGAPDVRSLFVLGPGPESEVLVRSEALSTAIAPLVERGLLAGLDLPSRYLPSPGVQRERQAALPEAGPLAEAIRAAAEGMPFRPAAFARFLAAVEESRGLAPLDAAGFAEGAPTVSARLSPLISRHGDEVWGIAPANGVADPSALEAAARGLNLPGVLFMDVKLEMERLLADYSLTTLHWALAGAALVLALLAAGLRSVRAGLGIAAPIGGAVLVVLAVLAATGETISLFHLAALLLLAGLAIDYSLFLGLRSGRAPGPGRPPHLSDPDTEDGSGAVLTCAIATLLTFGLLALCDTPVLHGIGLTVAIGVAAAFLLACALSAPAARR